MGAKARNEQQRKMQINITLPSPRANRSSWTGCTSLPGTGQVIPGSQLVRTTVDLRGFISVGEGIRIDKNDFRVQDPRDEVTLTLDHPWDGNRIENASMCRIEEVPHPSRGCVPLPCTADVLEGSATLRTSCDLTEMVGTTDSIFVDNELCKVTPPVTANQLSCDRPWPLASAPRAHLCRVIPRPWNGGMAALTCCVTTTKGSAFVATSIDLRIEISADDTIRIRTEEFRVRPPVTNNSFWVDRPSTLASRSGLQAYRVAPCFPLAGTVGMAKDSALATTSRDLRDDLTVGDVVEIGPEQFEVISPTDGYSLALSRSWVYKSAQSLTILKCPRTVQSGTQLPGTCAVVQGSRVVRTTEDLTDSISASDLVTVGSGGDTFQVVEPQDATTLTLNRPYLGPSAQLSCYRQPRSEKQRALEELAQKKMMCQSIYCLAKIEEEERAIAFTLPRSLSTLASSQWTGNDKKANAENLMVETKLDEDETLDGFIPPEAENGAGVGGELADVNRPASGAAATAAQQTGNAGGPDAMTSQVSSDGIVRGGKKIDIAASVQESNKGSEEDVGFGRTRSGNRNAPNNDGKAGASRSPNDQVTPVDVAKSAQQDATKPDGQASTASGSDTASAPGVSSSNDGGGDVVDDDFNRWMSDQEKAPTAEETTKKAKAKAEAETPTSPAQDLLVNQQFRL